MLYSSHGRSTCDSAARVSTSIRAGQPGEPRSRAGTHPRQHAAVRRIRAVPGPPEELAGLGARVAGVSAQSSNQIDSPSGTNAVPVIADPELRAARASRLPTFAVEGHTLYRRLALDRGLGRVAKVFYPVLPPDRNAGTSSVPPGYRGPMDLDLVAEVLAGEPRTATARSGTGRRAARRSYAEMTNVSPAYAHAARGAECRSRRSSSRTRPSRCDGTVKALFHTHDGHPLEAVLMRFRDGRRSVCVSSQSGCPLTCTFCATGQMRFRRNLTPWEILDQALHFRRIEPIDHVVFMGMGEPMLNFDAVLAAARRLPDLGVTHRRTTISTVGWLPGLTRFVDEVDEPIRLALSLHAPTDALRSEIMPVNDRYPLEDVLAECRRYFELRRRKVFVEYVMLDGVNDSRRARARARRAARPRRLQGEPDPVQPDGHVRRLVARADRGVQGRLDAAGCSPTVRLTRGRDIAAACGQLAATA